MIPDGFLVWNQNDSGPDAPEEPARPHQGHEGVGQGEGKDGAAGEEDHYGHQEDGKTGADGRCQDHGKGPCQNQEICQEVYAYESKYPSN